jgi:sulfate/thiosulfate transport system substrate-binding protein
MKTSPRHLRHWAMAGRGPMILLLLLAVLSGCQERAGSAATARANAIELLNVSYDPTRELFAEINRAFAEDWRNKTGQVVKIKQSHGGSGKQARAVIDGLEADVVTLGLSYDVDSIADKGKLIAADWQKRLPSNAAPYTSTIAFLVRKGNPKGIRDWSDLVKPGVKVITPNPKTSGAARWNYLAAWGYALRAELGDLEAARRPEKSTDLAAAETKARAFVTALFKNVPVLDSGARGATTTFANRGIGDVLINWENEILLAAKEMGDGFEMITPPFSIRAEPAVSIVDRNVDRHQTRAVAEAYVHFLYSDRGQAIGVRHHYRPHAGSRDEQHAAAFPKLELFTLEEVAVNWLTAQKVHFDDGGVFDQIYQPR